MVLKTTTIRGFLHALCPGRAQADAAALTALPERAGFLEDWLKKILDVRADQLALATEIAVTRNLVKGYSDTHERGRAALRHADAAAAAHNGDCPTPAATLARLRKAALADDTGAALTAAIKDIHPLAQAAE